MQSSIGTSFSEEDIKKYIRGTLMLGQVIPGYGHAVLRQPDPRFNALMAFASSRPEIGNNPLFQLVEKCSKIVPKVLLANGKVKIFRIVPFEIFHFVLLFVDRVY